MRIIVGLRSISGLSCKQQILHFLELDLSTERDLAKTPFSHHTVYLSAIIEDIRSTESIEATISERSGLRGIEHRKRCRCFSSLKTCTFTKNKVTLTDRAYRYS